MMKKILLVAAATLFGLVNSQAQDDSSTKSEFKFGAKAGYSSTILKVKVDGVSGSDDLSGFYIGLFGDVMISDSFGFHPELLYSVYSENGESSDVLQIPLLANYKPTEALSLLAGPQFDYLLNKEDAGGLKRLAIGIALGASYDISDKFLIDARYSFGLSDRLDGDLEGLEDFNVSAKFNYFLVGLGYRF